MSVYETLDDSRQFACRVIADHARATAFAIADGILPGNEGRNYVLRKIMRRAIYHGREHLGFKEPFFYKVCDFVVDQMHQAYPELEAQREFIGKMVRLEEERFGATLTIGLQKLTELFGKWSITHLLSLIYKRGDAAEIADIDVRRNQITTYGHSETLCAYFVFDNKFPVGMLRHLLKTNYEYDELDIPKFAVFLGELLRNSNDATEKQIGKKFFGLNDFTPAFEELDEFYDELFFKNLAQL